MLILHLPPLGDMEDCDNALIDSNRGQSGMLIY